MLSKTLCNVPYNATLAAKILPLSESLCSWHAWLRVPTVRTFHAQT